MKLKALAALTAPMALTAASFTRQRNSDVFGCADIGAHFKNRYSSNICFAEGEGSGEGDDNGSEGSLTFPDQAALDAYIEKVISGKKDDGGSDDGDKKPTGESLTEKRERERREEESKKADQAKYKEAVLFDSQFDAVMKDAAKFFSNPESVKTIKTDVKETDDIKRASLIAATAAKEFFGNQKNVDVLEKDDQEAVKNLVLNVRYEQDIDGMAAWKLMRRAVYNHNLKAKHDAMRATSGAGNGNYGYEKLDASLKAFYPEGVQAL